MNCPNCNNNNYIDTFKLNDYKIVQCLKCEILYNSKQLTNKKNFKKNIFNKNYYFGVHKPGFFYEERFNKNNPSYKLYSKIFNYVSKDRKVKLLDVGCANGSFLNYLNKTTKFNHFGIDVSSFAIKNAKRKKLKVKNSNLKNYYKKNKKLKFDIITFWDVLEHVDNVDDNFLYAKKMLKKSGYIFLITDIFDSLVGFLGMFFYKISFGLIKYPIYKFYIKQNSVYFKKEILFKICKSHKFKIVSKIPVDHPIDRINLNIFEKIVVHCLYFLGDVFKINTQIFMVLKHSD